ncbi:MAG: hypothetical protein CL609_00600 [Anaerolineaceae bacterium]|nr:hypothetical protein [Anaerolineaceae bacterium]
MFVQFIKKYTQKPWLLLGTLAFIILLTILGPSEKTLGANLKLVLLHGAWVWAGKVSFAAASLSALIFLFLFLRSKKQSPAWLNTSRASAYTGLFFWFTYLPMSLVVMQLNWGGFFFDEPRWKIPFLFGIVALLIQAAFLLFNHSLLTSIGNLVYGVVLWWTLGISDNVLHPDSPVAQSNSGNIQLYFIGLMLVTLFFAIQIAWWIFTKLSEKQKSSTM